MDVETDTQIDCPTNNVLRQSTAVLHSTDLTSTLGFSASEKQARDVVKQERAMNLIIAMLDDPKARYISMPHMMRLCDYNGEVSLMAAQRLITLSLKKERMVHPASFERRVSQAMGMLMNSSAKTFLDESMANNTDTIESVLKQLKQCVTIRNDAETTLFQPEETNHMYHTMISLPWMQNIMEALIDLIGDRVYKHDLMLGMFLSAFLYRRVRDYGRNGATTVVVYDALKEPGLLLQCCLTCYSLQHVLRGLQERKNLDTLLAMKRVSDDFWNASDEQNALCILESSGKGKNLVGSPLFTMLLSNCNGSMDKLKCVLQVVGDWKPSSKTVRALMKRVLAHGISIEETAWSSMFPHFSWPLKSQSVCTMLP